MICTCLFPINRIPTLFAPLTPNLAAAGNVSGGLSAAAQAAASAAAAAAASASGNAAMSAGLSASAMANLTAAANFVAAFKAAFHINLLDPLNLIEAALADLLNALNTNGFPNAVSSLPLPALPQLLNLQAVANAALAANLAASMGLMANGNVGAQLAAALSGSLSGSASLGMMLNANAAVKAAFGLNLAASGSMSALGGMLGTLGSNINSPPMQSLANVIPAATLAKALKMLEALAAIKKAFGIDLLKAGAGKSLNAALGAGLQDSLGKSASLSKGMGLSLGLGSSKGSSSSASGNEQSQAAANQMMNEGFNNVSNKAPAVPKVPNLLALLMSALLDNLGLDVVQNQPCGKKCLFALPGLFAPMGCLCPQAGSS